MARRAEQDDRVALFHALGDRALLLDHPGARSVDHIQLALFGALNHFRPDAMSSNDDGSPIEDVVECVHGLDPLGLKLSDDALVVDDLAERMSPVPGSRSLLGLIDCFAHSVAESGALRDSDLSNVTHRG